MLRRAAGCLALCTLWSLVLVLVPAVAPTSSSGTVSAQAPSPGASLSPVTPCRLLDTREGSGQPLAAGSTISVQVSGRCAVGAGGRAASLTVTATQASAPGYVTLTAASTPRPEVSNLNYRTATTVANSAVVALSPDGAIDVYVASSVHVVIDVAGVFVDASGPTSSGRFVPAGPSRLVDTRAEGPPRAGDLVVPLPAGVASDATAVAVSVTLTNVSAPMYVTAHPNGTPRPTSSIVNSEPLERALAVTVLAPVTPAGLVVHRSAPSDVVVDLIGWFTGPSAPASTDGLFVVQAPTRVWDSRLSADPLHPGGTVERQLVPESSLAVLANVTAVDATAPAYLSAYAAGTPQPYVSMLNATWRFPQASTTIVPTSTRGAAFYGSAGMHVLVDVAGYFTGAPSVPVAGPLTPESNPMPTVGGSALFVSDSSLAVIRWNGQLGSLQGADITADLESCRRLFGVSCRGREGYAPTTAATAIATAPGTYDTVVVNVGYNDFSSTFGRGFEAVVAAARARGIPRIVWMTYRESVGYQAPANAANPENYAVYNELLRSFVASGRYPEVVLADWNGYTATRRDWLNVDGVHVTTAGARAAGHYVSRTLAYLDRRSCPAAIGGPVAPGGWCASPDATGPYG
jgi:lysophospholipase L1-like esterase